MSDCGKVFPEDRYNRDLVANVHPTDRVNPEPTGMYNMVVIGAGTAGLVAAAGAAGLGARVALVERHLMGGDCLNVGCVPSKCLIRSSRAVVDAREAGRYGVKVPGEVEADFPAVMERMRDLRSRISVHDSVKRFQGLGIDVFLGEGRFAGPDSVEVEGKTLRFKKAVIATGARAVMPSVEGLEKAGFLTNETVFSLTERPERLAVIGAGPLGCELAQAFRRLGSSVCLIHKYPHILNREDPEAAEIIQKVFLREGMDLWLESEPVSVEVRDGTKVIKVKKGGEMVEHPVDEILMGAGRAPNVEGLGLESAGVKFDLRRGVEVDDHLRTSNPNIYAAGDVCLKYKFTHTADAAARIVIQNALFPGNGNLSALTVPWCTYTDPEIAHVGLYEKQAEDQGIPVETFTIPMEDVDRAVCDGEEEGFARIHVKKGTDKIVGAQLLVSCALDDGGGRFGDCR